MKTVEDIEKMVGKLNFVARNEMHERTVGDVLNAHRRLRRGIGRSFETVLIHSPYTRIAAVLAVCIALLIGLNTNGSMVFAEVINALNKVGTVNITISATMPDGEVDQYEWWFDESGCLRMEGTLSLIIDNGQERVVVRKDKRTAQFSDSHLPYTPVAGHYMLKTVEIFRGNDHEKREMKKLAAECTDDVLVYDVSREDRDYSEKAWVQRGTMLPIKIVARRTGQVDPDKWVEHVLEFDYREIDPGLFVPQVPDGYTELPRKVSGTVSGKVIDENGIGVAGATVFSADATEGLAEQVITDSNGLFSFKLPPNYVQPGPVYLPLILRAFVEGQAGKVAWTIIRNPEKISDLEFEVPGIIGHLENEKNGVLRSASGIVMQMEEAAEISGLVADKQGSALADMTVSVEGRPADRYGNLTDHAMMIRNLGGTGRYGTPETTTDENGRYHFDNLPRFWEKTKWTIKFEGEGYVGSRVGFRSEGPLGHVEQNISLYRAGLIVNGTLRDNYGQTLANCLIYAKVGRKSFLTTCHTRTDEEGKFRLTGCPVTPKLEVKAELSEDHSPSAPETYYPDVAAGIDYRPGQVEYEVELVAEKPELEVEVWVKNSAGEPLPFFSVRLRSLAIGAEWEWDAGKKITQRTDNNGYCRFVEVPNVEDLQLVVWWGNGVHNDPLSKDGAEEYKKLYEPYKYIEMPIKIAPGQKQYKFNVTLLTNEETGGDK